MSAISTTPTPPTKDVDFLGLTREGWPAGKYDDGLRELSEIDATLISRARRLRAILLCLPAMGSAASLFIAASRYRRRAPTCRALRCRAAHDFTLMPRSAA